MPEGSHLKPSNLAAFQRSSRGYQSSPSPREAGVAAKISGRAQVRGVLEPTGLLYLPYS